MTNYDIYKLVKFVLRKDDKGYPEILKNFSKLLQQSSLDHFKEQYNIYQQTQEINDSLSPFEVRQAVSGLTTTTTTITLPTNYAHFIGMYWIDADGYDRAFDLVTDDEWDVRCGSTITVPSNSYPICKIVNDYLYVKPTFPIPAINGYLYNWYAISNANFAPTDWIVPTVANYTTLLTYLGGDSVAGGKMKEIGTTYWNAPNTGAVNSSGFTLYGSGYRDGGDGIFYQFKERAYVGTKDDLGSVMNAIRCYYNTAIQNDINLAKGSGVSVRLLYTGSGTPTSIIDYDGNVYDVVLIGTQYWTMQNWKCTKLNDGTALTKVTDDTAWSNLITEGYCAFNNNESNV
jgi:uncharacterized protein (TIGR02145 family)